MKNFDDSDLGSDYDDDDLDDDDDDVDGDDDEGHEGAEGAGQRRRRKQRQERGTEDGEPGKGKGPAEEGVAPLEGEEQGAAAAAGLDLGGQEVCMHVCINSQLFVVVVFRS